MPQIKVKLFKPHKIQQQILQTLLRPDIFYCVVVLGRQTGKSLLLQNYSVYYAMNNPGSKCLIVSLTDSNIQKLYIETKKALKHTGVLQSQRGSKGAMELLFINGSKILYRSAGAEDNLRGESVDVLIVDEAAFVKQETIENILLPFLTVRGKKAVFLSTPKGRNWLYEYYQRGLSGEEKYKKWASFRCSSYENPYHNADFLQLAKDSLPEKRFAQEFLAEFVDSTSIFANIEQVLTLPKTITPIVNESYFAGIDVGLMNDRTVLTIIDSNGNCVNQIIYDRVQTPTLIENIVNENNKWKFKSIFIEINGQGLPIYQTLKTRIQTIEPFTTTSNSKQEIIDELVYNFNMINFRCINDTELRLELESFVFIQDTGTRIKYAAVSGQHDDRVMSLAIAKHCHKISRNVGSYRYVARAR